MRLTPATAVAAERRRVLDVLERLIAARDEGAFHRRLPRDWEITMVMSGGVTEVHIEPPGMRVHPAGDCGWALAKDADRHAALTAAARRLRSLVAGSAKVIRLPTAVA